MCYFYCKKTITLFEIIITPYTIRALHCFFIGLLPSFFFEWLNQFPIMREGILSKLFL